jgi:hypothetical protein
VAACHGCCLRQAPLPVASCLPEVAYLKQQQQQRVVVCQVAGLSGGCVVITNTLRGYRDFAGCDAHSHVSLT